MASVGAGRNDGSHRDAPARLGPDDDVVVDHRAGGAVGHDPQALGPNGRPVTAARLDDHVGDVVTDGLVAGPLHEQLGQRVEATHEPKPIGGDVVDGVPFVAVSVDDIKS